MVEPSQHPENLPLQCNQAFQDHLLLRVLRGELLASRDCIQQNRQQFLQAQNFPYHLKPKIF